jgi:hypothetical protein
MRADHCKRTPKRCARAVCAVLGFAIPTICMAVPALGDADVESLRKSGDLRSQRRHVWTIIAKLTHSEPVSTEPEFESWYGEEAVFAADSTTPIGRGIRGFARDSSNNGHASQSADAPVLTYTLYNEPAYQHIRQNHLYSRARLEQLRRTGSEDAIPDNRTVPPFPTQAVVVKTVWWPIAHDGITAVPVWDAERNPSLRGGNGYIGWHRVVAVDTANNSRPNSTVPINFAGRSFAHAHLVRLNSFYHIMLDSDLADRIGRDQEARKAASIALGRVLRAGDYLVLVAINLATREIDDWVWAAAWWHDRAGQGPFAADRPRELKPEWRNYLMQVAFDSELPMAVDGGPHICFNPWLEGRFPDGGHGGGTVSNCMTCHRRASYPEVAFLPVTRGAADFAKDAAYSSGRLRTSFLWSIALHATP